jgi:hypothetical protein
MKAMRMTDWLFSIVHGVRAATWRLIGKRSDGVATRDAVVARRPMRQFLPAAAATDLKQLAEAQRCG